MFKPNMTPMIATLLVASGLVCFTAQAQEANGNQTESPRMMPRDADPDWEVATVRPSDPNDRHDRFGTNGRHVVIENQTIEMMMLVAYGIQKSQILGGPSWIRTQHFDVDGIPDVAGEPNLVQLQGLVAKILKERFGMTLHREKREMAVFALTIAKDGPRLTPSKYDPDDSPEEDGSGADGWETRTFTDTSMQDLALMLLVYTDKPVVDQTDLKGKFDFKLKWTPDDTRTTDPNAPPGLFTAIQEQLGLKLVPTKAPVDVLVIDHVAQPSAN